MPSLANVLAFRVGFYLYLSVFSVLRFFLEKILPELIMKNRSRAHGAWVAELVDARDLKAFQGLLRKSLFLCHVTGLI